MGRMGIGGDECTMDDHDHESHENHDDDDDHNDDVTGSDDHDDHDDHDGHDHRKRRESGHLTSNLTVSQVSMNVHTYCTMFLYTD